MARFCTKPEGKWMIERERNQRKKKEKWIRLLWKTLLEGQDYKEEEERKVITRKSKTVFEVRP